MGKRSKAALWVTILSFLCGLVIWQAVYWHSNGMYLQMLQWLGTGKGYLTALYNLAVMLVLGALLGFLMEETSDLLGLEVDEKKKRQ